MAIYLIDYENTKNLAGIKNLTAEDFVVIFYSQNANSLTFEIHKEIVSSAAKIEYKCVGVGGQNALDFQLSSYLGYLIKSTENTQCDIYIVTKDKGFSYVTSFWKSEKNVNIKILSTLSKTPTDNATAPPDNVETLLRQLHLELKENEIEEILAMLAKYKTTQTINGYLNKLFKDSTKAGTILKLIKPFIKK